MEKREEYQNDKFVKELEKALEINLGDKKLLIVSNNFNRTIDKIYYLKHNSAYDFKFTFGQVGDDIYGKFITLSQNIKFFKIIYGEEKLYTDATNGDKVIYDLEDLAKQYNKFVKETIKELQEEYKSIKPSDKNIMRRKDIIDMIYKLHNCNICETGSVQYYKNKLKEVGFDCKVTTDGQGKLTFEVKNVDNKDNINIENYIKSIVPIGLFDFKIIDKSETNEKFNLGDDIYLNEQKFIITSIIKDNSGKYTEITLSDKQDFVLKHLK